MVFFAGRPALKIWNRS